MGGSGVWKLRTFAKALMAFTVTSVSLVASASDHQVISVTVNAPGSFPYLYFDRTRQTYEGLVPDFLTHVSEQAGYSIVYLDASQFRSEENIVSGRADLYLANPEWLQNPSRFIASSPLIAHPTYLYSTQPFGTGFTADRLSGVTICAHRNYVYTGLESGFEEGRLTRVDSPDHTSMAHMLARGRCDFAVYNPYNAMDAFYQKSLCHLDVFQSPVPTSVVELPFVMRADAVALKALIDRHIEGFAVSGELEASLAHHLTGRDFPKRGKCE
ncbi:MAG: transporter substrate-binding domain-containing protein [Saccharospirillum sp.]|uniref:substrate-binding periplasmic protein n=1 Tax=Saccharospirillum sp. TaxID=2033801 RepID=UPI00329750F5